MDRIYTEATITKSLDAELWETDDNGNPIVIIEASNENLDYDGERVMRSALMDSKEYFLKNGVISYDHKHIPSPDNFKWDPKWNAEKYVIGKPLEAWVDSGIDGKPAVKVKAVLSRSNDIAKEIIKKLSDGLASVKASVGGRKVKKSEMMDKKTYKDVSTITGVDWDEVALTYKPVNQTLGPTTLCPVGFKKSIPALSPKEFVKSLTVGSSANPGDMSGGNTLQTQSLEGDPINALLFNIRNKKIKGDKAAIDHLVKSGYSKEKACKILKMIIDKKYIGDLIMEEDKNASDLIETHTDELKKAIASLEDGGDLSKSKKKKDGTYVMKGGYEYLKKADGKHEKMDDEAPDYEDDDDDLEKSLSGDFGDTGYDATEDVAEMKKSIAVLREDNADLKSMVATVISGMDVQNTVLKSMGALAVEDSEMMKSIAHAPQGRKSQVGNLNLNERFGKSQADKINSLKITTGDLMKSMKDNGVDLTVQSEVNLDWRRSGGNVKAIAVKYPEIINNLIKE